MIVDRANKLSIKERKTAECPGHKSTLLGAITVGVRFTRHLEDVKFLVINGLTQDFILVEDRQSQFKVRLDWEQNLIRFHAEMY